MAIRPLAFGAKFSDKGRKVQVKAKKGDSRRFVVEVETKGRKTRRSEHTELRGALSAFASAWRGRHH